MPDEPGSEAVQETRYANFLKVGNNAFEFVLDFGQFYEDWQEARLHTRIITSPAYAKAFCGLLGDSLRRYEERSGSIPEEDLKPGNHKKEAE